MYELIRSRINVLILPHGRRAFAQTLVLKVAEEIGDEALIERLKANIALDRTARFQQQQQSQAQQYIDDAAQELRVLDPRLDRSVNGFQGQLLSFATVFGDDYPGPVASEMQSTLFPNGAGAITQSRFVDQHAALVTLLQIIDLETAEPGNEWQPAIEQMGLVSTIERIRRLNDRYGELLIRSKSDTRVPDFRQELRAAEIEGHLRLLAVVSYICFKYNNLSGREDAQSEIARRLLAPILDQEQVIRSQRRSKRLAAANQSSGGDEVGDVDPDSGAPASAEGNQEDSQSHNQGAVEVPAVG